MAKQYCCGHETADNSGSEVQNEKTAGAEKNSDCGCCSTGVQNSDSRTTEGCCGTGVQNSDSRTTEGCCGHEEQGEDHLNDCLLCGAKLQYFRISKMMTCSVCGRRKRGYACCANGHYVCDSCHSYGSYASLVSFLRESTEKDPVKLFEEVIRLPGVHMHGPEHHRIVPLVLLTAYRNCGGKINYDAAMQEANSRAAQVPGGTCGYWGVCGAAAGAGIYASVVLGSNPLNQEMWPHAQKLVSEVLSGISSVGGVRCCKRTSRIALERAAKFTTEITGVNMMAEKVKCGHVRMNHECLGVKCPYWPEV